MQSVKSSDIITAIPPLAENGSNWSIFKMRFRLALSSNGLYSHYVFDGKKSKPIDPTTHTPADPKGSITESETKLNEMYENEADQWDKDELVARYILSRVIPDSMLRKIYSETRSVKEMWEMLTKEFEQKTSLIQADLRAKFQNYRCPEKGDIRIHLNRLRQMHQDLENIGVTIEDGQYAAIIMQSLPSSYSDFMANIAAAAQLVNIKITADNIQHQLEQEFDRRKTHHSSSPAQPKDAAFAANSQQRNEIRCWNCDAVGHKKWKCPKPPKDKERGSSKESANVVEDEEVGSWMAIPHEISQDADDDWLTEIGEDDLDFLEEVGSFETEENMSMNATCKETGAMDSAPRTVELYDSGTTRHMSPERDRFLTYKEIEPKAISGANQEQFYAIGTGDMSISVPNKDGESKIRLTEVLHAPKLGVTLISIGRIDEAGYSCIFSGGELVINDTKGSTIGRIPRRKGLYAVERTPLESANLAVAKLSLEQLHRAMGHISYDTVKKLIKDELVTGVNVDIGTPTPFCETCLYANGKRKPVPKERQGEKSSNFGDQIHSDVWGPAPVATIGGNRYYVSFTDDATRETSLYLLKKKSDTFHAYETYHTRLRTEMNVPIKILHSDRGGEYLSDKFIEYLETSGTIHRLTVHDTSEQNGVAERLNGILMVKVRAMLHDSGLPKFLWGEAISHAVWLKNRTSTKALNGKTPFEAKTGQKPDLSKLKEFGCKAWVLQSKTKLDGRVVEARWVGFDQQTADGHRIYWPNRRSITVERNVTFDLSQPAHPPDVDIMLSSVEPGTAPRDEPVINEPHNTISTHEMQTDPTPSTDATDIIPPRIPRIRKPSRYVQQIAAGEGTTTGLPGNSSLPKGMQIASMVTESELADDEGEITETRGLTDEMAMAITTSEIEGIEPRDIREARKRPDWTKWEEAMIDEMTRLKANETWELVEKPRGANVIGSKWVYRIKKNAAGQVEKYRARLVAQGFSQIPGIDYFDTFAPVAKTTSTRVILTFAARYGWPAHQMDVKSAYLNGTLNDNEEIYLRQPPGFVVAGSEGSVLRLRKALYGLKQSGRRWYQTFSAILNSFGFTKCESDHAVFIRKVLKSMCIIIAHVDDLTITGSTLEVILQTKKDLGSKLEMSDLGELHWLLGIEVKRDYEAQTISLSQRSYIQSIVDRYGLSDAKPLSMPLDPHALLDKQQCPSTTEEFAATRDIPYREAVGSLMYAALGTRPDIAYAVHHLARFGDNPGKAHWEAVKRVIRYLKGTKDLFLVLGGKREDLVGYTDADGMSNEDRHAISGYVFQIDGSTVSWSAKRQDIIALSTTEAEYVATTHAAKEAIWLRSLLSELFGTIDKPTTLYSDNQSSIALTKDDQFHARTKHIDIRFHFIRWIVNDGKIALQYCPTEDMTADILTKALPSPKAKHFAAALGLRYL